MIKAFLFQKKVQLPKFEDSLACQTVEVLLVVLSAAFSFFGYHYFILAFDLNVVCNASKLCMTFSSSKALTAMLDTAMIISFSSVLKLQFSGS